MNSDDESQQSQSIYEAIDDPLSSVNIGTMVRQQYQRLFSQRRLRDPVQALIQAHTSAIQRLYGQHVKPMVVTVSGNSREYRGPLLSVGRNRNCTVFHKDFASRCHCLLLLVERELYVLKVGGVGEIYLPTYNMNVENSRKISLLPGQTITMLLLGLNTIEIYVRSDEGTVPLRPEERKISRPEEQWTTDNTLRPLSVDEPVEGIWYTRVLPSKKRSLPDMMYTEEPRRRHEQRPPSPVPLPSSLSEDPGDDMPALEPM